MTAGDPPATGWSGLPLDHVAIALASLDDGAAYAQLGWRPAATDEEIASQGVAVRLLTAGAGPALELLAPLAPDTPVGRFLARRGPGLHHLAYRVADLEAEVARLSALGAAFVDPTPRAGRGGSRVAFLHPRWTGGVLIELVAHP